jgi:small-conductance mechanosensitive channel
MNVRSEVNMHVLAALRAAGVGIPYPQRVVHLQQDPPAAQARAPAQPASGAADGA